MAGKDNCKTITHGMVRKNNLNKTKKKETRKGTLKKTQYNFKTYKKQKAI